MPEVNKIPIINDNMTDEEMNKMFQILMKQNYDMDITETIFSETDNAKKKNIAVYAIM